MPLNFFDRIFEVDAWKRLGRAVLAKTLNSLRLNSGFGRRGRPGVDVIDGEVLAAAAQCIGSFFNKVKHHKSVVTAHMDLDLSGLSINDLSEFVRNNLALETLSLGSMEPVSRDHSTALSRAISISSVKLKSVNIRLCHFENDGYS